MTANEFLTGRLKSIQAFCHADKLPELLVIGAELGGAIPFKVTACNRVNLFSELYDIDEHCYLLLKTYGRGLLNPFGRTEVSGTAIKGYVNADNVYSEVATASRAE